MTPIMGQYQKHVEDLEADGGHGEDVDGHQLLGMILEKCAPRLRRRFAVAHDVFADTALTDVEAEFEEFAMDAGCTPRGILLHILRISARTSGEMTGRPGWPQRTFQVQNRRTRHDARQ